jgi:hypothetical protein
MILHVMCMFQVCNEAAGDSDKYSQSTYFGAQMYRL